MRIPNILLLPISKEKNTYSIFPMISLYINMYVFMVWRPHSMMLRSYSCIQTHESLFDILRKCLSMKLNWKHAKKKKKLYPLYYHSGLVDFTLNQNSLNFFQTLAIHCHKIQQIITIQYFIM